MLTNVIVEAIKPVLLDEFPVEADLHPGLQDIEYLMALLQHDWHVENHVKSHQRWAADTFHKGLIDVHGAVAGPQPPGGTQRFQAGTSRFTEQWILDVGMFGGSSERLKRAQGAVAAKG
jgi:hypothetical protein